MNQYQDTFNQLHQNLNTLREREAKYGGSAPLELLNQIADHQDAIALTEQAMHGNLTDAEWREALQPLLIAIQARPGEAAASSVSIGDIGGSIQHSTIAGRDVNQITVNVVAVLGEAITQPNAETDPALRSLSELVLKQVAAIDPRTAQRYPQNPTGFADRLQEALAERVEADRGLAARLEALLARYEQTQPPRSGDVITLSGTGNISRGTGNTSVTATGGGIAIGSVGGDVHLNQAPGKDDK